MQLKYCFYFLFLWITFHGFSQQDSLSVKSQISVITCGPGTDLYATFGHSAFRVQDPILGFDVVYNYGTFNFNTSNFYLKFARGKLLYSLSRQRFENFLYTYQLDNRWVKEQLLDLSQTEKEALFRFLENNYKPENRDYKYDFLFNNCATKIPDVLAAVYGEQLQFDEGHMEIRYTFRQLIQQYLRTNSWSSFGIDIALGAVIDNEARVREHMFLPDYVLKQLKYSLLNSNQLVQRERSIMDSNNHKSGFYFTTSPLFWLLLLFIFTATITYLDLRHHARSRWLDFALFLITGIIGLLIFFLWFLTDHTATANNFNMLWAFPLNLVVAYIMLRKKQPPIWLVTYLLGLVLLMVLAVLFWVFKIQIFSPLILLVWGTLLLRYLFLYRYFRKLNSGAK